MENSRIDLAINSQRLKSDFDVLSEIGRTEEGGVNRPAFSDAHLAARAWFRERIIDAGLKFNVDNAGNHSAILSSDSDIASTLLLGSHLDTVPNGGRYEGALGIVSALEVLRAIKEKQVGLKNHLEAIDFTDKEGTLIGQLGSTALAGKLTLHDTQHPRGGRNRLLMALERAGLTENGIINAKREPITIAGYLEVQIDQSSILAESGADIGIVTKIAGIGSYHIKFIGQTFRAFTPLQDRLDAGQAACSFNIKIPHLIGDYFPECVANVGSFEYTSDTQDSKTASVIVSLEYRALDLSTFELLESALIKLGNTEANHYNVGFEIEFLGKQSPALMNNHFQEIISRAAESLGLKYIHMDSMAGNNAQSLADLCQVGLILIPKREGASHSPYEFTDWINCVNGANVLLQTALRIGSV